MKRNRSVLMTAAALLATGLSLYAQQTVTQGGWGSQPKGGNPGILLDANFAALYPGGVVIGGGFTITLTTSQAVRDYLRSERGIPGALAQSYVDPVSRTEAGVFGKQVLALQLNVDFSDAGLLPGGVFGDMTLMNTGTSLDGMKVRDILAAANAALGGGAPPTGSTVASLNELVSLLNESFNDGVASDWATTHLQ